MVQSSISFFALALFLPNDAVQSWLDEVGRTFIGNNGSGTGAEIVYHIRICIWAIVTGLGLAHWFLKLGRFKEPVPDPSNDLQEPFLPTVHAGIPLPPTRQPKKIVPKKVGVPEPPKRGF